MWIFTGGLLNEKPGFFSAVQHDHDSNVLVVRTRDEVSARQLATFAQTEIVQKDYSDYPFRVFITKDQMKAYLCAQVDDLDYGNFKSHVSKHRVGLVGRKWSTALHDVWEAMIKVAPRQPYTSITGKRRPYVSAYRTTPRDFTWDDFDRDEPLVKVDLTKSTDEIEADLDDLRAEEDRLVGLRELGELDYDDVHEQLLSLEEARRKLTETAPGFDPATA